MDTRNTLYIPDDSECRTCNICSRHCPTFKLTNQQEESPRGRLKTISKAISGQKELQPEEIEHLGNCVECYACEKVCPSKMQYSELLRNAKSLIKTDQNAFIVKLLKFMVIRKKLSKVLFWSLRAYQKSGIQNLISTIVPKQFRVFHRLHSLLYPLPDYKSLKQRYPAKKEPIGNVALFTGCLSNSMDNAVLHATIKVLTHMGYNIEIPAQQQCCGALHSRENDTATSNQLIETNLTAFDEPRFDAIIYTATACGSQLTRTTNDMSNDRKIQFHAKLKDINQFIVEQEWLNKVALNPLNAKIAVHEPCSQQHPLGTNKLPYQILEKIPGVVLTPLPANTICCGSGGTYMLTHPETSDALRNQKLDHLTTEEFDYLLTSNFGCAVHFAAGCVQGEINMQIAHPVELVSMQLPN